MSLTLLCAALAMFARSAPAAAQTTFTLKAGQELDSNPLRLADGGSDAGAALRIVAAAESEGVVGDTGVLTADLRALGRAFYATPSQDSLGLTLDGQLMGAVRPRAQLGVAVSGRGRMEPVRDCDPGGGTACAVNQDYRSLRADARALVDLRPLTWSMNAGARHFAFGPDARLSWYGAGAGTSLSGPIVGGLRWSAYYDATWRRYLGDRTQIGTNGGVYLDAGVPRRDRSHVGGASIGWSNERWSLSLRYAYIRNLSNSTAKGYSRHQIDPSVTAIPVGALLIRLSARIMRASYDVRGALDASLNVDEEARNRFRVVVEHPLYRETLFVEAGWAVFAQAFEGRSGADEERVDGMFRRHVAHLGLTVRLRPDR